MIFAHQGGWDEMLMVMAPIGLFTWLMWLANKRAEAKLAEEESDSATETAAETAAETAVGTDPASNTAIASGTDADSEDDLDTAAKADPVAVGDADQPSPTA